MIDCEACGADALVCICPTILTRSDVEKFFEEYVNKDITPSRCCKCAKEYYFGSYGDHLYECDECYFARFPKEQVEEFYRGFF